MTCHSGTAGLARRLHVLGMDRRLFLTALGTLVASPSLAAGTSASLRGTLDAREHGVRPDGGRDQSAAFQRLLNRAFRQDRPIFVPPGRYIVGDLTLPPRARLLGLSRTATLVQAPGRDTIIKGSGCRSVRVEGLAFEGRRQPVRDAFSGLVHLRGCPDIVLRDCGFDNAAANAVALERCGGAVDANSLSRALGHAALYSVEASGLSIRDNIVRDCANGGILVHRWNAAADGTQVRGNRVSNIRADAGGTGQNGNGINVFRAHDVQIAGNAISECAFSAIRGNGASNALVTDNMCRASGETAIYAEFAFQGAVIADNVIDGATLGISMANFDTGGRLASCTGNLVRNLRRDGPYPPQAAGFGHGIFAEADTVVAGNVIEEAAGWGLGLGWGPYLRGVVARGNIVREARVGAAVSVAEGAGHCLIEGNSFAACREGAVVPHLWAKPAARPLAQFANVTARGNVTG